MKNHENLVNLQKIYNFQYFITLLSFFIATNCFLHKRDNIFAVHLGKLKLLFSEYLVAMVTGKMCSVKGYPLDGAGEQNVCLKTLQYMNKIV